MPALKTFLKGLTFEIELANIHGGMIAYRVNGIKALSRLEPYPVNAWAIVNLPGKMPSIPIGLTGRTLNK